jgi:hypothetical protein
MMRVRQLKLNLSSEQCAPEVAPRLSFDQECNVDLTLCARQHSGVTVLAHSATVSDQVKGAMKAARKAFLQSYS